MIVDKRNKNIILIYGDKGIAAVVEDLCDSNNLELALLIIFIKFALEKEIKENNVQSIIYIDSKKEVCYFRLDSCKSALKINIEDYYTSEKLLELIS